MTIFIVRNRGPSGPDSFIIVPKPANLWRCSPSILARREMYVEQSSSDEAEVDVESEVSELGLDSHSDRSQMSEW